MSRVLNKKTWPYQVTFDSIHTIDEAVKWCRENLPGKDRWCYVGLGYIHFKSSEDASFCTLRWS